MKRKTLLAVLGATVILTLGVTACGSKQDTTAQSETVIETETEEVIAEVPEATEVPETEEVVAESTEQLIETETEEVAADTTEVPETEQPGIAVKEMSATKYAKSSVNVRKGPGTEYDKVGSLSTNQQVAVTGQADSGWYRIDMNGEAAYVSNKFLSDEKVAVNTAKKNTSAGASTAQNNATDAGNTDNNAGTQQAQPQAPAQNNNAGTQQAQTPAQAPAQQPSQPQTPPSDNSQPQTQQPSQPQTPPAAEDNGPTIVGGGIADPEFTENALNDLPENAFNVQVHPDGTVSYEVPALKDQ